MLHKFTVVPSLTDELTALQRVAYNLWLIKIGATTMVQEYPGHSYVPSYTQWQSFVDDDLARWKEGIFKAWPQVRIEQAEAQSANSVAVGSLVPVSAQVALGDIPVGYV
jgi:hypothetical protein